MDRDESEQRLFLRQVLADGAARLGAEPTGEPVFGWRDRTIGALAIRRGEAVWLRATGEHREWTGDRMWTGNQDAAALTGVAKPTVLARSEWEEPPVVLAAEVMTLAPEPVCSSTPELRKELDLPDAWWEQLADSLARIEAQPSARVSYSEKNFAYCLHVRFGPWVDLDVSLTWATSHCDLHWANLTAPGLTILDWETWGRAPQGIDAATLYCHSLLVPKTARKVYEVFRDTLDTPAGKLAQLSVIDHLLSRAADGEHPDLVLPLHRLADQLLNRRPEGDHPCI
ncbi:aminoglycoside phosphotransferase [Salinactinospora qingdaonensis]|uniref:Phosphotransferase enzyme family protein n=1 Tax=Salinactinospora qingdaonensis TaxID=702744 RepID=A0ABP7FC61_9ACTN